MWPFNMFRRQQPRVVYVPSRRKAALKDYEAKKAEKTAELRAYVAAQRGRQIASGSLLKSVRG